MLLRDRIGEDSVYTWDIARVNVRGRAAVSVREKHAGGDLAGEFQTQRSLRHCFASVPVFFHLFLIFSIRDTR